MSNKYQYSLLLFFSVILIPVHSCNNHQEKSKTGQNKTIQPVYKKPISNFQDSLKINAPAAVFYYPDSLQLLQIKSGMDSSVYDGTMHEFFYQIKNAKIVLQKTWPQIKIIDAKNCRFLFQTTNGQNLVIDLDKKNDAYGLFLFDQTKSPQLVDMTNIETALSTYFNK